MAKNTLFWHDYETFGTDPQRDKACQFAGLRTDFDFNIIGEPLTIYCRPADDCLPHPDACLITGITPQLAHRKGVCEAEFINVIHNQLSQPGTCTLGYNNIRFDDEVTRNLLYRNFYDPYAREWRNNNSRWDLIDVVRATKALRPDGIVWPENEDGRPSFRLEELTKANGIEHVSAHDALSDVYATIAMAKLIKRVQPKLYQYLFTHRIKPEVIKLLQLGAHVPVVHISGKYPAKNNCMAVVLPVVKHPENNNGIIVYDLSIDPEPLLDLTAEQIKQRVFTAVDDLPEGVDRIPLKTVHINKCPVLAPISVIRKTDADRLKIDLALCDSHLQRIKSAIGLTEKLMEVFRSGFDNTIDDPDLMIYSGGFFNPHDKAEIDKIRNATIDQLADIHPDFQDSRLPEMLFRYRARNFPETLNKTEKQQWQEYCHAVMVHDNIGASLTLQSFMQRLQHKKQESCYDNQILLDLQKFADETAKKFNIIITS